MLYYSGSHRRLKVLERWPETKRGADFSFLEFFVSKL